MPKWARSKSEALMWSWDLELGQEEVWKQKGVSGRRTGVFGGHGFNVF